MRDEGRSKEREWGGGKDEKHHPGQIKNLEQESTQILKGQKDDARKGC